jgi:hypothetical protein
MDQQINEILINGQVYVLKGAESACSMAKTIKDDYGDECEYKIVRTRSAGVFAGYLAEQDGLEVVLLRARRLWYWSGAFSLSQLAIDGTSKPKECKFPEEVSKIVLTEAIEILDVTEKAQKSIQGVPVQKV